MKRQINLEVSSCEGCPFLHYQPMNTYIYDSGYECNHPDQKNKDNVHISDYIISKYNHKLIEFKDSYLILDTKYHKLESERPIDPFIEFMNKNCPLPQIL